MFVKRPGKRDRKGSQLMLTMGGGGAREKLPILEALGGRKRNGLVVGPEVIIGVASCFEN